MKPIIEIRELSKQYRVSGVRAAPYLSLRESLAAMFRRTAGRHRKEAFRALKSIDLEFDAGDTVGIIGRNGAGKSTLLKILSRITYPTSGKVICRGRVAGLLEVGTGFHPELTGRENIFLNGSILGMKRMEIRSKFEEIVHFSGVQRFLDEPIKRYSSGMQLRLAFAVAAFLEIEILVIDEVLAVGDQEFQRKCMLKMDQVSREQGRTLLFVSHNMESIVRLCRKAVWLDEGMVKHSGSAQDVIKQYLSDTTAHDSARFMGEPGDLNIAFTDIGIENEQGQPSLIFGHDEKICVSMEVEIRHPAEGALVGFAIFDTFRNRITTIQKPLRELAGQTTGKIRARVMLPPQFFVPKEYVLDFAVYSPGIEIIDKKENLFRITIMDTGSDSSGSAGAKSGHVIVPAVWERGRHGE